MKLLIKAYSHSIEDTHVQVGQVRLTLLTSTPIFCLHPVIVLKTFQTNYPCGSELFWSVGSWLAVLDKNFCSVSFRSMKNSSRTWRTLALITSFISLQSRREQGRRDPVSRNCISVLSDSNALKIILLQNTRFYNLSYCAFKCTAHPRTFLKLLCVCVCVHKVQLGSRNICPH